MELALVQLISEEQRDLRRLIQESFHENIGHYHQVMFLAAGVLEGAGARVLSASSASEAIARASAVRPDILVTDLGLPGEDGYAVLERVRGMFPDIPALALTAYARATDRERVLAAGFKHHVVKPVDPQQLLQLIAAAL